MRSENTLAAKSGEAKKTRVEKAIELLITTAGNPFNQKIEEFKTFYPAVLTAKRNGMKNKQIIKIVAEGGLKLYPAVFEKLMSAMTREANAEMCAACGQSIIGEPEVHSTREPRLDESRPCSVEGN